MKTSSIVAIRLLHKNLDSASKAVEDRTKELLTLIKKGRFDEEKSKELTEMVRVINEESLEKVRALRDELMAIETFEFELKRLEREGETK